MTERNNRVDLVCGGIWDDGGCIPNSLDKILHLPTLPNPHPIGGPVYSRA
jgi:hypothetical protein